MFVHTPWQYNDSSEIEVKFIENVVTKYTVMLWKNADDGTIAVFCKSSASGDQPESYGSRLFHDESRAEKYALTQLT